MMNSWKVMVLIHLLIGIAVLLPGPSPGIAYSDENGASTSNYFENDQNSQAAEAIRELKSGRLRVSNTRFAYLITDEMTLAMKINQVYRRELDVEEQGTLLSVLREIAPMKLSQLDEIFKNRIDFREGDTELIQEYAERRDSNSHLDEPALLKELQTREMHRTQKLCERITLVLDRNERQDFVKFLVSRYAVRSLTFPLVAAEFGLSDDAKHRVRERDRELLQAIFDHARNKISATAQTTRTQGLYGEIVSELSTEALERFLVHSQQLEPTADILDAIERMPKSLQPIIQDIYEKKLVSDQQSPSSNDSQRKSSAGDRGRDGHR